MTHAATIIFCDIVGYSKNDDELQTRLIKQLSAEVTHQLDHRLSELYPSVVFLPTGDGMAIVLLERGEHGSTKVEVFRLVDKLMSFALSSQRKTGKGGLRIGVHRGPAVSLIRDINRQLNVCGYAINYCQRVMDAAHRNQVLLSEDAYQSLVGDEKAYAGEPFSKSAPAKFSGLITIPAKHGLILRVRVMFREGIKGWERTDPFPHGTIAGKQERTKFIVERLDELIRQPKRKLVIYEQSAFGTFGFPENREGWDDYQPEYAALLLKQKKLLKRLAAQPRTTLYLMFRPVRVYNAARRAARMKALITCLKQLSLRQNVRFGVTDNYQGPNRLIVKGLFCIEGYKIHDTAGYELSFVKTSPQEIRDAITAFRQVFDLHSPRTNQAKLAALNELHRSFEEDS